MLKRHGKGAAAAWVCILFTGCGASLEPLPPLTRRVGLPSAEALLVVGEPQQVGTGGLVIDTSIAVPGQSIRIPLDVTQPGVLHVYAEAGAPRLDLTLTILDEDEGQRAHVDDSRGLNPQSATPVAPGRYCAQIGTYAAYVRTGPLRVTAWMTAAEATR
jgi:hypothetical protein